MDEHAVAIGKVSEALRITFGHGYAVRAQMPLSIGDKSQPELDVAVVRGDFDDYGELHPKSAELVVEVAESLIRFDRTTKAKIYSKAKLQEYWIVDLNADQIGVFRQPDGMGDFAEKFIVKRGDRISPFAAPKAVIEVTKLLPKTKSSFGD